MSSSLPRRDFLKKLAAASAVALAPGLVLRRLSAAEAATAAPGEAGTVYLVGYAHLDTQWRWSYPVVIREFLHNTLVENFQLFEKYPNYIFNFTGANRYRLMKEYFPKEYARMQGYVKTGRWFPAGSSWEEGIVDEPSSESVVRHVLYGNQYFRRELGTCSNEFMLPDSFGFPASLPTLLAHCGLKGFSTQKLSWNSAAGIPFNVGSWIGPDGRSVVAALNCTSYGSKLKGDESRNEVWIKRLKEDQERCGVALDYRYYGTGDRGGSPGDACIAALEESLKGGGPIKLISAKGSDLFDQITPAQIAKLPTYKGELLLSQHSAGTPSSQAFMKKLNRKNEFRADEAERAAVAAALVDGLAYPQAQITEGWQMLLAGQFHDILAGTCKPDAYTLAWNDGYIARNRLTQVRNASIAAVARALDTSAVGVPLVVYNPLSADRRDVVEATVRFPESAPAAVEVTGPDGKTVAAQVTKRDGREATIAFLAAVPSVGVAAFAVRGAAAPAALGELSVSATTLGNARYTVTLNAAGDVASIRDLKANRELLREPARLAFLREDPTRYMAWNMEYDDATRPPYAYVDGPATITIAEQGPARVALRVERQAQGSTIVQTIRLSAGDAGERIEFDTFVDWHTSDAALKAVFPLTVSNKVATYNWEAGTIERATDNPKLFEWPAHQWFDLTDASGNYGVSVLEDCKYGSDKPDDSTLRLTLMFTPGAKRAAEYHEQISQDFGRHQFTYALLGHEGDWRKGGSHWQAARLNQPLAAFQTDSHPGTLGTSFGLLRSSTDQVMVKALKQAEESEEIVVRLQELSGHTADAVTLSTAYRILSAREVDGQEQPLGAAKVVNGALVTSVSGYSLRAFALTLDKAPKSGAAPAFQAVALKYNDKVTSADGEVVTEKGGMDQGRSFAQESFPVKLTLDGIGFEFGPADGKNAIKCAGETIELPAGSWDRLHFIAAQAGGRDPVPFTLDGETVTVEIQNWDGIIGQPDYRLWNTVDFPEITYDWDGELVGVAPGYLCTDALAWHHSHRHAPNGENQIYDYAYLFHYTIALKPGAKKLGLPKSVRVRLFAATVSSGTGVTVPVSPDLGVI